MDLFNPHKTNCASNGWPGGKCDCGHAPDTPDIHGFTVISERPLTRREQFAMAAMQGMIACGASKYRDSVHSIVSSVASGSVNYADELIKELDKGE